MAEISVEFTDDYNEGSRRWVIQDLGRDPNSPPVVFDGYLDYNDSTGPLQLHSDGTYGRVQYQRSDGPQQIVDSITDGSKIQMS